MNAKLGHWPYRPVKGVDALLRGMDALGIARAAVSSVSAVHYLNPQDGNDELVRLIAPYRDRLIPMAVLRLNFAGWQDDLRVCLDEYGVRGVVLYPNYHEFDLADPTLGALMDEAAERRIPVCVQSCMEDVRRQFHPVRTQDVSPGVIGEFARDYPAVNVIAFGLKWGQPQQAGIPSTANLFFDISNYETMGELEFAVEHLGPDRILFGTNFPMFNLQANVDKLRLADISEQARQSIARTNGERLVGV